MILKILIVKAIIT